MFDINRKILLQFKFDTLNDDMLMLTLSVNFEWGDVQSLQWPDR